MMAIGNKLMPVGHDSHDPFASGHPNDNTHDFCLKEGIDFRLACTDKALNGMRIAVGLADIVNMQK